MTRRERERREKNVKKRRLLVGATVCFGSKKKTKGSRTKDVCLKKIREQQQQQQQQQRIKE